MTVPPNMRCSASHQAARRRFSKRGHTYKFGQWNYSTGRLDFRSGESGKEQFDDFMRSLPDNTAVWERIAAHHEAQVFICLWMRTWNREFDLSTFALGELARRRLRLHIDTYLESDDDRAARLTCGLNHALQHRR